MIVIWRHSPECFGTFRGMFGDIPRNIWVHCPECLATFPGIFGGTPQNVWGHSPECLRTFPGMFGDIPWNVWRHSPECLRTFPEMFGDITRNITFSPFLAFPAFRSPFLYSWFYIYPFARSSVLDIRQGSKYISYYNRASSERKKVFLEKHSRQS